MKMSMRGPAAAVRIGIFIVTLVKLTDCDVVTEADKGGTDVQKDIPYLQGKIKDYNGPEAMPVLHSNDTRCRISEYQCGNRRCVPINKFCDGGNDCGDSSDEPRHCTRCNKTYYGDIGRTYEVELHRPREDLVPYVCLLTITAAGGLHGDLVQRQQDALPSYPGSRSVIGAALIKKGIPPSALDVMLESLSPNSLRQYNVYLKKWYYHCLENNVDLYSARVPEIIEFLIKLYHVEGAQYGSLNSCRSALSLLIGDHLGQDESIKRLFKGIYRSRPPRPRYDTTWDVSVVLAYLENLYPNETLSLEDISRKLITLLAIVTAHRVQTFSIIHLDNIITSDSRIKIKITELIKTSRDGSPQPTLNLPFFNEKPAICPALTLQCYISKTNALRGTTKRLFVGLKKPHAAVSSQTLSRWIRGALHASGVDVATFGAHSARHAATSAAHRAGLSIDQIRRTAGWSANSDTFLRFYNRPVNDDSNAD